MRSRFSRSFPGLFIAVVFVTRYSSLTTDFPDRSLLDSPFVQLSLKNPLYIHRGRVNRISVQPADFHQLLNLCNRYLGRGGHQGIEVPRRLAVNEITHPIALPGLHKCEVRWQRAFHYIGPPIEFAGLFSF